ncbi:phage integrase SAM-like domain-containing protein [Flagellimonas marina]|uniref:Phage integrase SAM-like domain-containing protein n=1 Tax=Flagellimonas marina TaxID=1775168 RepID=A0ABV8PIV4_9FLAO
MPTTAKIILDTRSHSKTKGGHPISIYISNHGHKYVSLKRYSEKKYWGGENVNRRHPEHSELHRYILDRSLKLIKEVEYCNEHNLGLRESANVIINGLQDKEARIQQLESELRQLKGENAAMLMEFWDGFIQECRDKGMSTDALETTKNQVSAFLMNKDMLINDINYEFLNDFSTYKLKDNCNRGGLNHYLATFRRVFRAAQKIESLHIKPGNPFSGLITKSRDGDIVTMSVEEMQRFKDFQPNNFTYERNAKSILKRRDLWLFQFYIGGHDFIDVSLLKWSNIKNDRIRFKRHKNRHHLNGGPLVDNILVPEALEIIKKHGTKKSKKNERVFNFLPLPNDLRTYKNKMANIRRSLRAISEGIELSDTMKTKSTRYIFKTWGDEMLLDFRAIQQIQGHSQEGVSARYGARLPNEVVDDVLKKIVDRKIKEEKDKDKEKPSEKP